MADDKVEVIEQDGTPVGDESQLPEEEQAMTVAQQSGLFNTNDPVEVIEKAQKVADALKKVLVDRKLLSNIAGKEYVVVEGWQTLGSMLGVTAICTETEKLPENKGYKATVEARKISDGKTVVGRAVALCTRDEAQWKERDDYALLSMAQTRATSKALRGPLGFVVKLAGYEATPAEEMDGVRGEVEAKQSAPAGVQSAPAQQAAPAQSNGTPQASPNKPATPKQVALIKKLKVQKDVPAEYGMDDIVAELDAGTVNSAEASKLIGELLNMADLPEEEQAPF